VLCNPTHTIAFPSHSHISHQSIVQYACYKMETLLPFGMLYVAKEVAQNEDQQVIRRKNVRETLCMTFMKHLSPTTSSECIACPMQVSIYLLTSSNHSCNSVIFPWQGEEWPHLFLAYLDRALPPSTSRSSRRINGSLSNELPLLSTSLSHPLCSYNLRKYLLPQNHQQHQHQYLISEQ
jgi:hypothetical protein